MLDIELVINKAWDNIENISSSTDGEIRGAVNQVLDLLDNGNLRIANKIDGNWYVNEWLKKAILLSFLLNDMKKISGAAGDNTYWWDKIDSKFLNYSDSDFKKLGFRATAGSVVRYSAYIAPKVILMPSFINLGAYVDSGTMIDTWATVGSCAQIGKNVHISGGTGIGGVLEPLQSSPVIIEDDCFIGARSEIVEGVIVEKGAVISMGVHIGQSTKIVDRNTGKIYMGKVPSYSVIVPGTLPSKPFVDGKEGVSLSCAVIIKQIDENTRSKISINELLRDN